MAINHDWDDQMLSRLPCDVYTINWKAETKMETALRLENRGLARLSYKGFTVDHAKSRHLSNVYWGKYHVTLTEAGIEYINQSKQKES